MRPDVSEAPDARMNSALEALEARIHICQGCDERAVLDTRTCPRCVAIRAEKAEAQRDLLQLFFCAECVDEHGPNPQSVSCYCSCHSSSRDEARWPSVRDQVVAALKAKLRG